jgi:hypothetical protein
MKLREVNQMNVLELNLLKTEKNTFIDKIKGLEDKLVEAQVQLEKYTDSKLAQMLKGQKCSFDKIGLGFVKIVSISNVSNIASSSKIVFVKHEVAEPQNACDDKVKAIVISCENANIKPTIFVIKHSKSRSLPTCHQCGIVSHMRPNCC